MYNGTAESGSSMLKLNGLISKLPVYQLETDVENVNTLPSLDCDAKLITLLAGKYALTLHLLYLINLGAMHSYLSTDNLGVILQPDKVYRRGEPYVLQSTEYDAEIHPYSYASQFTVLYRGYTLVAYRYYRYNQENIDLYWYYVQQLVLTSTYSLETMWFHACGVLCVPLCVCVRPSNISTGRQSQQFRLSPSGCLAFLYAQWGTANFPPVTNFKLLCLDSKLPACLHLITVHVHPPFTPFWLISLLTVVIYYNIDT